MSDSLVQRGFTLIRDVQFAYTDMLLSADRLKITAENTAVRAEIMRLTNARLNAGDISELEAATARADSANAEDDLTRARLAQLLARNNLNFLLGNTFPDTILNLQPATPDTLLKKISREEYLKLAFEFRPDLSAAKRTIEAAGKSLGWEKSRIISFTATLNYQYIQGGGGSKWIPNTFNPGFQMEIPLFNRNQGNIEKATAIAEKAAFQYVAVQQKVALDISQAFNRYEQLHQSYQIWNQNVLPTLEEAVTLVQQSFSRGDISYLPVLEAIRQLQNGKIRKAEITAELRRAVSLLNYAVGQTNAINP
jgi:cobalt-zinc-cadmium efflux system outer membrane protein